MAKHEQILVLDPPSDLKFKGKPARTRPSGDRGGRAGGRAAGRRRQGRTGRAPLPHAERRNRGPAASLGPAPRCPPLPARGCGGEGKEPAGRAAAAEGSARRRRRHLAARGGAAGVRPRLARPPASSPARPAGRARTVSLPPGRPQRAQGPAGGGRGLELRAARHGAARRGLRASAGGCRWPRAGAAPTGEARRTGWGGRGPRPASPPVRCGAPESREAQRCLGWE